MLNPTSEKAIEKLVAKFCKDHGMVTLKLEGDHAVGKPDRAIWYEGEAFVLEIKSKGKKPTDIQYYWLNKFRKAGTPSYWVDNWPDAEKILKDHYAKGRENRFHSKGLSTFDY